MNSSPKKLNFETQSINLNLWSHSDLIKIYESKADMEVWGAFDKGDEMAFNYMYRTYVRHLSNFGSQFCDDNAIVHDSIQNVFIALRKKRGNLNEVRNIKAYLFKCLYREIIKKLNKKDTSLQHSSHLPEHTFELEYSPETKMIMVENQREKAELVKNAVEQLSARQRQAVLLLFEEGMSYKEISIVMEFSEVKSARKLIYRALGNLKELLKEKHKKFS